MTTDKMEPALAVHRRADRDENGYWAFTVYDDERNLGYDCFVSAREAARIPESSWWAQRGNSRVAEYEAMQWAETRAREMAAHAFRQPRT